MKKIMIVDEHKVVNYTGGVEKVICNFSNEFTKRGYEVSIVCMDREKGRPSYALDDKVKFINLCYDNGNKKIGGMIWFWKKIQKEVLRTFGGADMCVAGHRIPDPKLTYFFSEFCSRLRKVINTEKPDCMMSISADGAILIEKSYSEGHSLIPIIAMCHVNPLYSVDRLTEDQKCAWRKAACLQVLMPKYVSIVEKIGVKNAIAIANAVEQVPDNDICDLTKCKHTITTVGRLDGDVKRQHLLVEAFSLVADRYPQWSVHIYGNIANRSYKKKLDNYINEHNLAGRIMFDGETDDILGKLKETDIFIFPSEREGFGLAITEAMSIGLPVVACNDCIAMTELITSGKSGILVEPVPEAIAKKISDLIEDKSLRIELGKAAHESMKQYTPQIVWDKWEELIQNIVK